MPLMAFLGFDAPLAQVSEAKWPSHDADRRLHHPRRRRSDGEQREGERPHRRSRRRVKSCSARSSSKTRRSNASSWKWRMCSRLSPSSLPIASSEAGKPPKRKRNTTSRRSRPHSPLKRAADLLACKRGRRWYGDTSLLLDARSACASRCTRRLYSPPPHTALTFLSVACTRARALVRPVRAVLISSSL